jgi:hypothetical protein
MPAQVTVRPDSSALDFSRIREEVLRAYQPATPEESLLAHQIARAWFRLQNYYEMEARIMEKQNLAEMFETDLARFKALNSAIAGAERMWRQAILEFQRARRRASAPLPRSSRDTAQGVATTGCDHSADRHSPRALPPVPIGSPRSSPAPIDGSPRPRTLGAMPEPGAAAGSKAQCG